jgi:amino acid transporter
LFNTFLAKKLPMVEGIILVVYVVGFVAIIIPLWVLAPRASAHDVFTQFSNAGGWSSVGTAVMVGLSGITASLGGFDCAVHMCEEIKNASQTLPRSIMTGVAVNGVLGFLMVITVCFTLGDVDSVLATKTGFPFIQVFYNTTQNFGATNVMTAIVIIVLVSAVISEVATASRQLWSFARDGGVPFSSYVVIVSGVYSTLPHASELANIHVPRPRSNRAGISPLTPS